MLVWSQEGDRIVVQRATRHGTQQVHEALFPDGVSATSPAPKLADLKEGLRQRLRRLHAGR